MPISPEEVENKQFLMSMRGYDKDEVHAFLSQVAQDYRTVLESKGGNGAVATAPAPAAVSGDPFAALGEEVGSVLAAAKASADTLRKNAEDEAADLRRRAQEEAASLKESSERTARELREQSQAAAQALKEESERTARELKETSEREASRVRADAQREAGERLHENAKRVQRLQATEAKLREGLYNLEMMLAGVRSDIDAKAKETEAELTDVGVSSGSSSSSSSSSASSTPAASSTESTSSTSSASDSSAASDSADDKDDADDRL